MHVIYYLNVLVTTVKPNFVCKEYNLIKVYYKYSRYLSLIIIDIIVLQLP